MEAIRYNSLGNLDVAHLESPTVTPDTVLVRIASCGICHTDIDVLHGRYGNSTFPLVPGHEYSGIVEEIGENVSTVSVGERVVVDPNISCGECRACCRGLMNLCENLQAYGVTRNGGFAQYSVVKATNIHPIGDMPFDVAALAEPLACVLNGVGVIETIGAQNALVFGAGPIGVLMSLALKDAGIQEVLIADLNEDRLTFVETLGLIPVHARSDQLESMKRSNDVVVDATGVPKVTENLIEYAANGGSVLFFGVCPPDSFIRLSPFDVFRRQIRIAGAHSLNHNIPQALDVLRRSGDVMRNVISHQVSLPEIAPYLEKAADGNSMKVQYKAI